MTNPVLVVKTMHFTPKGAEESKPAYKYCCVWCPGCKQQHRFTVEVYDGYTGRPNGEPEPTWEWDGNEEKPTFSPSLLAYYTIHHCAGEHPFTVCDGECGESHAIYYRIDGAEPVSLKTYEVPEGAEEVYVHVDPEHPRDPAWGNCHSFLKSGVWEFLTDSAHDLAGQKVPLPPLPDWVVKRGF
jgi:hypothetical protein